MGAKMSATTNALNWFEISVNDMDRATNFYGTAFDVKMEKMDMPGFQMTMFPTQDPHSGGALVKSDMHKPSMEGTLVYLNGNPDLQQVLDRIPAAGGKVLMPKTQISPVVGYMAVFADTEGNALVLHSNA